MGISVLCPCNRGSFPFDKKFRFEVHEISSVQWINVYLTFGKENTIAMYVYTKNYEHYLPGISVSWILLPEFSVENVVFQKFINFQISWKLSQGLTSVTICPR